VLGQILRWLPVGVLFAVPGTARVTADLVDAARLDGCRASQLHVRLIWPLAVRSLALSAIAVMVLVFGELTASVLLSPPGVLTLSVRFFTLAHYSLAGQAATICVIAWICMVIPWSVLLHLLRRPD
jgi:ABC-type Fe3+ transport system permease subunit